MNSKSLALILGLGLAAILPARAATPDQDAARIARFNALHLLAGTGPGTGAPLVQVPLGAALSALERVTQAFDYSGTGDADYWMRTAADYGRAGQALGRALVDLGTSMGPGPVAGAVSGMGAQLTAIDWSGTGDADYWMARVKDISQRISAVGVQLHTMAQSCDSAGAACPPVALAAVLRGLARVARSADYAGRGDAEYWMRTTKNFCFVGRAIGQGLSLVAPTAVAPVSGVISGMAGQLTSLSEAGDGTADYWMARARGVAEQMAGVSRSLEDLANNL